MGKRGGGRRRESEGVGASSSGLHTSLSLREEASGRKQSQNAKSILKLKHLQNLAEWAASEGSIPSLGAFFGRRFADFGESLGISPDSSLFPCQRCETILQPGFNCTVRIEKNRASRWHRGGKTNLPTQTNVVYTCHFCSYRNLKQGTVRGHMKQICPPKASLSSKPKAVDSAVEKHVSKENNNSSKVEADVAITTPSPTTSVISSNHESATPLSTTGVKLLDSKRRKRKKPGPKGSDGESLVSSAPAEAEKGSDTSKKRRKSWTTLKEIAETEERKRSQRFTNFSIPFVL